MWVVGWKKRMANVNFKDTALAMYLSDDSHQAMDLPDHTLIGVYRLSILARVLSV